MRREQGSATFWILGLSIAVLFLGGLSLDLWRGIAVRRELSAMADAAANAAANGIIEEQARTGDLTLDESRATALARALLERDDRVQHLRSVDVKVNGVVVTVTLEDDVPLSLLRLFAPGEPFLVRVTASAAPELRP